MRITPDTRIGRLLDVHPEVTEAMAWYGVDLEEHRPGLTLEAVCRYHRLDVHDMISDLLASIDVDEDVELDSEEESCGELVPDDEPVLEGAWGRGPGPDVDDA